MKLKSLLLLSLLFFCLSASAQTAGKLYAKGQKYFDAGNHSKGVEYFQKAANLGLADAQHDLALCYVFGDGVAQNETMAAKWWKKAAKQGHASAQYHLGCCYENGIGLTQNYNEAVKWYRKAAAQGNNDAIYALKELGEM